MNVLGVIFDAKLTWSNHVALAISKAKRKLYGLRLLKRFFTQTEMKSLLDSYFYSFDELHKINGKRTPNQITMYQRSLSLYRALNANEITFETVTVLNQMVCTRRQLKFEIIRNFNSKIGLNTTADKLYPLNGKIGLDFLNLGCVHYKKIMKIQFLKYGKT